MAGRPNPDRAIDLGLVFVGGAAGTAVRELAERWVPVGPYPWGTLTANVIGAFALGALVAALLGSPGKNASRDRRIRLLLGVGFCGGLTTYSTFVLEIHNSSLPIGAGYAALTITAGLVAAAAGMAAAGRWSSTLGGRRQP